MVLSIPKKDKSVMTGNMETIASLYELVRQGLSHSHLKEVKMETAGCWGRSVFGVVQVQKEGLCGYFRIILGF